MKIHIQNEQQLLLLIKQEMSTQGPECDLNHLEIGAAHALSWVLVHSQFNGNILQWDNSNLTNMSGLFHHCDFNDDLSKWDTSKVRNMTHMFADSQFNQDICRWNTARVINMYAMFYKSLFNGDISGWYVCSIQDFFDIFKDCLAPQLYWSFYRHKKQRNVVVGRYQKILAEKNN